MADKQSFVESFASPDFGAARARVEALFAATSLSHPNELDVWAKRPLDSDYAMAFFDSMPVLVGVRGQLRSKRLHVALGILSDGRKDVVGFWIGPTEGFLTWSSTIGELRERGMTRIGLVSAEEPAALPDITRIFPSAKAYYSIRHLVQRSVDYLPAPDRARIVSSLIRFFSSSGGSLEELLALQAVKSEPRLADFWLRYRREASVVLALPRAVRDVFCTTTALESVTEKLCRRGLTKRSSFKNEAAVARELLYALSDASAVWRVSPQRWAAVRRTGFVA